MRRILLALLWVTSSLAARQDDTPNGDYGFYYTWPKIKDKVEALKKAHPDLITTISLGKTLEGREILAMRITGKGKEEKKPEIGFQSGIHPREQPAQILLLRLVEEMLDAYGKDERLTKLIDERVIWVIPVLNVDGKVYDMKHGNGTDHGAEWRKNRRKNSDGSYGIDLDRQFSVRWGGSTDVRNKTAPTRSKSDYYIGTEPMSEPEAQALATFFDEHPLRAFVDVHSPFKSIFFPSHLSKPEFDRYTGLAKRMRDLQKDAYALTRALADADTPEERGGDCGVTYAWAYYTRGVYAFIFEIFADPKWYPSKDQIDGEYANFRDPMLYLIEEAANLPLAKKGTATLKETSTDKKPEPGTHVVWTPKVEGRCDYAVLVSEEASIRVTSEFRLFPLKRGFDLFIPKEAKSGGKVPMALYLWDREHAVSVARFSLLIE